MDRKELVGVSESLDQIFPHFLNNIRTLHETPSKVVGIPSQRIIQDTGKKTISQNKFNRALLKHLACYETQTNILYAGISEKVREPLQSSKQPITVTTVNLVCCVRNQGLADPVAICELTEKVTLVRLVNIEVSADYWKCWLILGTADGILKSVGCSELSNGQNVHNLKLHTLPIIDFKLAPRNSYFSVPNIALVLVEDQSVFMVNVLNRVVIGILRDSRLSCRKPLTVQFHISHRYYLQTHSDGCLRIWGINEKLLQKIKQSQGFIQVKGPFNRYHSVTPILSIQSCAIKGLVAAQFIGSLVILLTKNNILKCVALNFENEQSYLTLFQHQIGELCTGMQVFPAQEYVLISNGPHLLQLRYDEQGVKSSRIFKVMDIERITNFFLDSTQTFISIIDEQGFLIVGRNQHFLSSKNQVKVPVKTKPNQYIVEMR